MTKYYHFYSQEIHCAICIAGPGLEGGLLSCDMKRGVSQFICITLYHKGGLGSDNLSLLTGEALLYLILLVDPNGFVNISPKFDTKSHFITVPGEDVRWVSARVTWKENSDPPSPRICALSIISKYHHHKGNEGLEEAKIISQNK